MTIPPIIYGTHAVLEAIMADKTIDKLFIDHTAKGPMYQNILIAARQKEIPYSLVPTMKLNSLVARDHQGIVACLSPVPLANVSNIVQGTYEAGQVPLILLLDGITDVGNLGAIIRTAVCFGVHAMILPMRRSASLATGVLKTSAGAILHLPICREDKLQNSITYLQSCGLQILACDEKAQQSIYQVDLKLPTALILGSEDKGIHPSLLSQADQQVSIPIVGPVKALNVSVAAAIFLYETFRQRNSA
jgi:23S rRNA (guanosine2251-2'-O)-methyltransferase